MDRTNHKHLYYVGENLVDGNDIKIQGKDYPIKYIKKYYIAEIENEFIRRENIETKRPHLNSEVKIDEDYSKVVKFFKDKFWTVPVAEQMKFFKPFLKNVLEKNPNMAQKTLVLIVYAHFTQFNGMINDFHWVIDYNNSKSDLIQTFKSGIDYDQWYLKFHEFIKQGFLKHSLYNMMFFDDFTKKMTKVGRFVSEIWLVTKIVAGFLLPYVSIIFGVCEIFDHYINRWNVQFEYNDLEYNKVKIKLLKERFEGSPNINMISEFQRMTVMTEKYADNYFDSIYNQLGPSFEMQKNYYQRNIFNTWSCYVKFVPVKLDLMEVAKTWKKIDARVREKWIVTTPAVDPVLEVNNEKIAVKKMI